MSEQTKDAATAADVRQVADGVRETELEESKPAAKVVEAIQEEAAATVPLPESPKLEKKLEGVAPTLCHRLWGCLCNGSMRRKLWVTSQDSK